MTDPTPEEQPIVDFSTLSDEELDELRIQVITEQENRRYLKELPDEIERMSEKLARLSNVPDVAIDAAERGTEKANQNVPDGVEVGNANAPGR